MKEDNPKPLGESELWEEAYRKTRRSIEKRRKSLEYFDWSSQARAQILDLGTGDGLDLGILHDLGAEQVIGFDVSPRLLCEAPTTRKVIGDAHRLPFASASLDVVLANSVLHHFEPPRVFEEIGRVLKPGGLLRFMEPRPCVQRRLIDFLTLTGWISRWIPLLRARRIGLLEEFEVHYRWLGMYGEVPALLEKNGMLLRRRRHTMFGIFAEWRKT